MPQLITLDRTGDTRQDFSVADAASVAAAEARFKELTGLGFTAATKPKDGSPGRVLKAFDPKVEDDVVFIPHLVGG